MATVTKTTVAESRARNAAMLKRLGGLNGRLGKGFSALLRQWGDTQIVDMHRRFTHGPLRRSGSPDLAWHRRALQNSFGKVLEGTQGRDRTMSIFSKGTGKVTRTGQQYATTQEGYPTPGKDTVITAKRAGMLTVPTFENIGPLGLPKYMSAADLRAQGRTLLVKTLRGAYLIMVREGDGVYRPMWVLRRSVKIPARLRFYASFKDRKAQRPEQLGRVVKAAIAGG